MAQPGTVFQFVPAEPSRSVTCHFYIFQNFCIFSNLMHLDETNEMTGLSLN